MNCILNVTDHEYDRILQMNHDALVWNNADQELMKRLGELVGTDTVEEMRQYDGCRMQKHVEVAGLPRIERGPEHVISPATVA